MGHTVITGAYALSQHVVIVEYFPGNISSGLRSCLFGMLEHRIHPGIVGLPKTIFVESLRSPRRNDLHNERNINMKKVVLVNSGTAR